MCRMTKLITYSLNKIKCIFVLIPTWLEHGLKTDWTELCKYHQGWSKDVLKYSELFRLRYLWVCQESSCQAPNKWEYQRSEKYRALKQKLNKKHKKLALIILCHSLLPKAQFHCQNLWLNIIYRHSAQLLEKREIWG